jgi:Glycosyl hydrolase family 3 N terminal domain
MLSYQDSGLPTAVRVADLLARMTLAEKVGQCMQLDAQGDLDDLVTRQNVGSLLHVPPDRMGRAIELAAATRLGIPLLLADDCIHGHSFWPGATIFGTQLAVACSWRPENARRMARITAVEATSTGFKWTFSPVLCIARDLRWGPPLKFHETRDNLPVREGRIPAFPGVCLLRAAASPGAARCGGTPAPVAASDYAAQGACDRTMVTRCS